MCMGNPYSMNFNSEELTAKVETSSQTIKTLKNTALSKCKARK